MLSLSKRPGKWSFRWFLRTLRHEIGLTACSGCPSVRGNGLSAGFHGRYDTKSALQRILADQASVEMALPLVFPDTMTRNRTYSIFWQSKRPQKWAERLFPRTLRHKIGPTACSGCPSVWGNGAFAGFHGHYDTISGLQRVLAVEASGEMAFPLVFADVTTRNRDYSVFWLSKCPGKWPFCWFSRTLRHEIGLTACSDVQASRGMAFSLVFPDTTTRNRPYSVFWMSKRPGKWVMR